MKKHRKTIRITGRHVLIVIGVVLGILALNLIPEATKASQSSFQHVTDPAKLMTSENLNLADIAWFAENSYLFDCPEVVRKLPIVYEGKDLSSEKRFLVQCKKSDGTSLKLRVGLRDGKHPLIREELGN
jgi:hypothetical protein